jgi:hypothetical protein
MGISFWRRSDSNEDNGTTTTVTSSTTVLRVPSTVVRKATELALNARGFGIMAHLG